MERQYDLVIIGAGPAGLSAALYGSRAGLKTLILENGAPGGKLIKTNKISNYPGVKEIEGTQLAMDMFEQATSFQAEYAYGEVNKIDENKTVRGISKAIYEFLVEQQIYEKVQIKIQELNEIGQIDLANEYESSIQTIIEILDEIVLVFKDDKITIDKYNQILKIGFKNSSLTKIPGTQDQVIMGDVDRSRSHKVKAIFIIGLNDGEFQYI